MPRSLRVPQRPHRRWDGKINLSSKQDQILSSEGADILPVKPTLWTAPVLLLAAWLQPGEDKAHLHLAALREAEPSGAPWCSGPCWLLTAGCCPGPAVADHRFDSSHRQPAHSQRNRAGAPLYPSRRHLRPDLDRARLQLALEYRLLRKSAHRARRLGEGHHPRRLCQGKAHHPRDQLQGS